jgi:hypothetical protein
MEEVDDVDDDAIQPLEDDGGGITVTPALELIDGYRLM